MGELSKLLEGRIRKRVSDLTAGRVAGSQLLLPFFNHLKKKEIRAFLFGGTLRDFAINKTLETPRDLDLVISHGIAEVEKFFLEDEASNIKTNFFSTSVKRNRFGGLKVSYSGHALDVWQLADTWAFKEKIIEPACFEYLPRTTFLNLDGIVFELFPSGRGRQLFEKGFFSGYQDKLIELNLRDNPSSALCVIRAVVLAYRTGFRVGPKLGSYIAEQMRLMTDADLSDIQRSHYGTVRQSEVQLRSAFGILSKNRHRRDPQMVEIAKEQFVLNLNIESSFFNTESPPYFPNCPSLQADVVTEMCSKVLRDIRI